MRIQHLSIVLVVMSCNLASATAFSLAQDKPPDYPRRLVPMQVCKAGKLRECSPEAAQAKENWMIERNDGSDAKGHESNHNHDEADHG